jgi:hypothetical protein
MAYGTRVRHIRIPFLQASLKKPEKSKIDHAMCVIAHINSVGWLTVAENLIDAGRERSDNRCFKIVLTAASTN